MPARPCSRWSRRSSRTDSPARRTSRSRRRPRSSSATLGRHARHDRRGRRRADGRACPPTEIERLVEVRRRRQGEPARSGGGRGQGTERGTTVAATAHLAHLAGVRVFSTGGLGGVHRGAQQTFDESADLGTLAPLPLVVVSAGVKSILDIPLTLERLETLNLAVVGYRTTDYPGFYIADSGHDIEYAVDSPAEIAAIARARDALGISSTLLVANPVAADRELPPRAARRSARACPRGRRRSRAWRATTPRRSCSTSSSARPAAAASRSTSTSIAATSRWAPRSRSRSRRGADARRHRRSRRRPHRARRRDARARHRQSRRGASHAGRQRRERGGRGRARGIRSASSDASATTRSAAPSSESSRMPASRPECSAAGRTGAIVILVDAVGERTMITDRGAAAELGPIDPAWLPDAEWVHLPLYGFAAAGSRAALLEAARSSCGARCASEPRPLERRDDARCSAPRCLAAVIATVRPAVVFANADEAALAVELGCDPRRRLSTSSSAAAIPSSSTSTAHRTRSRSSGSTMSWTRPAPATRSPPATSPPPSTAPRRRQRPRGQRARDERAAPRGRSVTRRLRRSAVLRARARCRR